MESPLGAFHQLLTLSPYDTIKKEYNSFNLLQYGETRSVKHLQFTSWPPDGPPTSSAEMIEFFHKFRSIEPEEDTPIIVHCTYVVQKYLCNLKFCILSMGKTSYYFITFQLFGVLMEMTSDFLKTAKTYPERASTKAHSQPMTSRGSINKLCRTITKTHLFKYIENFPSKN